MPRMIAVTTFVAGALCITCWSACSAGAMRSVPAQSTAINYPRTDQPCCAAEPIYDLYAGPLRAPSVR
jgi:hypothetical protein